MQNPQTLVRIIINDDHFRTIMRQHPNNYYIIQFSHYRNVYVPSSISGFIDSIGDACPMITFLKIDADSCPNICRFYDILKGGEILFTFGIYILDVYYYTNQPLLSEFVSKVKKHTREAMKFNGLRCISSMFEPNVLETFQYVIKTKNITSIKVIKNTLRRLIKIPYGKNETMTRFISVGSDEFKNHFVTTPGCVDHLISIGFKMRDNKMYFPYKLLPEPVLSYLDSLESIIWYIKKLIFGKLREAVIAPLPMLQHNTSKLLNEDFVQFIKRMKVDYDIITLIEDPETKQEVRKAIPTFYLQSEAKKLLKNVDVYVGFDIKDCYIVALLHWFKNSFFKWFKPFCCIICDEPMELNTISPSNQLEKTNLALTTEIYFCALCNTIKRFPRYNHPIKLLETRMGRCGEWSISFTSMCRTLGYNARYVMDTTDHVWTEIYSENFKRWIHFDASENVYDTPLLYEIGWRKTTCCVIAYSYNEIKDVTYRYIQDHKSLLSRRSTYFDKTIQFVILQYNKILLSRLSTYESMETLNRSVKEDIDLIFANVRPDNYGSRISGKEEWRRSRGEL